MPPKVWNRSRQWMGNLVPAVLFLPGFFAGLWVAYRSGDALGPGLWILLGSFVLGWCAVNWFGLYQNATMRVSLVGAVGLATSGGDFVGFARPAHRSPLDPHEDVGFLVVSPEKVQFLGETLTVELPRERVLRVRLRPNIHSLLGLGGWVSIEGDVGGKPVRMLVEPRTHSTLWANARERKRLAKRLSEWLA